MSFIAIRGGALAQRLVLSLMLFGSLGLFSGSAAAESPAVAAARGWLEIIDARDYAKSWDEAE